MSSRRARKALELRDKIVECAAALFADRGYPATTMEDIGERADVSRATVFNYFPRKEDLVLAWFDGGRAHLARALASNREPSPNTSDQLRSAFRVIAGIFTEDSDTGRAMVRAWLHAGGPLLTPDSDTSRLFADFIRAGQQRGEYGSEIDADSAGHLLFDAYLGLLIRWVTAKDQPPDLEKSLLVVLDIALSGISARAYGE